MSKKDEKLKKLTSKLSYQSGYIDFVEASQRLLSANTLKFANAGRFINDTGYDRHISLDSNSPDTLISDFASYGSPVSEFIDFGGHPALASARTPNIRLYKLLRGNDYHKTILSEIEIPVFLYGNTSAEAVLNPQDRSNEAYFLGLNFDLKDQTAFGAARHVRATLSLGFNSFNALSKVYQAPNRLNKETSKPESPTMHDFAYVDLIRRTNGASIDGSQYADYSIRMEVGWNAVTPSVTSLLPEAQGANEAGVSYNNIVLLLELEDFELDIQQDGKIRLDISYHAFIERELSDNYKYDVLSAPDLEISAGTVAGDSPSFKKLIERLKDKNRNKVFYDYSGGVIDPSHPNQSPLPAPTATEKKQFSVTDEEAKYAQQVAAQELAQEYISEQSIGGNELVGKISERIKKLESELSTLNRNINQTSDAKEKASLQNQAGVLEDQIKEQQNSLNSVKGAVKGNSEISKKAKDSLEQVLDRMDTYNKIQKYQGFMKMLSENGKIYSVDMPKKELLMFSPQFTEEFDEEFNKDNGDYLAKKKQQAAAKAIGSQGGVDRSKSFLENLDNLGSDIQGSFKSLTAAAIKEAGSGAQYSESTSEEINKRYQKAIAIGLNKNLNKATGLSTDMHRVHYVYFGDIIETVIGNVTFAVMQSRRVGLLVGGFVYNKSMDKFTNQERLVGGTKNEMGSVNFSDVPISIEMFSRFFSETIINKNVTKMSFLQFMNGMINQLIIPSLNEEFAGVTNYNPVRVRTSFIRTNNPILLGGSSSDGAVVSIEEKGKASNKLSAGRYDLNVPDNVENMRKLTDPNIIKQAAAKNIWHYLFIYGVQEKNIAGITATYEGDMEKGIYHFTYGDSSSAGTGGRTDLIKDIKFIKVKKTGQREMMVERQLKGGRSGGFLEIFNIFDVEMTMVGNNLLHPGKHIYIRPVISGFSRLTEERSIVTQLGLGGYYMVTDVSNEIGPTGEWQTSVKAAWQSNGGGNIIRPAGKTISQEEVDKLSVGQYYSEEEQMTTMSGAEENQTLVGE